MTRTRSRNAPAPTWVSLVESALAKADDFMPMSEIVLVTGGSLNQISAALYSLRAYRAVDSIESNGRLYWFSTPDSDTRSRHVEQRRPEEPGTRRRRATKRGAV